MADEKNLPATQHVESDAPLTIREDVVPARLMMDKVTDALPAWIFDHIGQMVPFTKEQEAELDEDTPDDEIDILPDGMIYASHEYYRRKLNKVFGRGQWTVVRVTPLTPRNQQPGAGGSTEWYADYFMLIGGIYYSDTTTSRKLYDDNRNMDLGDVAESMRSDAIRRCCKDLGIARECWNRRFQKQWRDKYAIEVVVQTRTHGNVKRMRRKDADPLDGELRTRPEEKKGQDSARATGSTVKNATPPASTAPVAAPAHRGVAEADASAGEVPETTNPASQPQGIRQDGVQVRNPASPASSGKAPADADTPGNGERKAGVAQPVQPSRVEAPGPTDSAQPASQQTRAIQFQPQQERAVWKLASDAGVVVGENADALIDILRHYSTIVPVAGKLSAENASAMMKGITAPTAPAMTVKLQALFKQINAAKVHNPDTVETI